MELNKENYFSLEADREYFSVSQFKSFRECEAKTIAKLNEEWQEKENEAFLIGSYVYAWSEGTLEEFKAEHKELYKKDGTLKQKYEIAEKMINALSKDDLVTRVREGQKEVILTAELFGAMWKVMIDTYNPDKRVFADIKTTRELHKKYWNDRLKEHQNFIEYHDYLLQMAVYSEVIKQNTGEAAKREKYNMNYVEGILKTWAKEGKEEVKSGSTGKYNAEGQGKYTGFKPPPPKCDGDIDTSDVI